MKIIRIIKVEDTREYEEVGDRFVPVAGSGEENECARCGRSHVVHASVEVEHEDGKRGVIVVGTGCMTKENAELGERATSAARSLVTLKRNRQKLAKVQADRAAWNAAKAKYSGQIPAVEVKPRETSDGGQGLSFFCGDTEVWAHRSDLTPYQRQERIDCARNSWLHTQIRQETGLTGYSDDSVDRYLMKEIAKLEKRLQQLIGE